MPESACDHRSASLTRYDVVMRAAGLCLLGMLAQPTALQAETDNASRWPVVASQPSSRVEQLSRQLDRLIRRHEGDVSLAVVNLDTGESLFRNASEPMPTASLIKLAVLIEAYRQDRAGLISLNEEVTLREEDKVPGSGILTSHFSAGARITLRDAVRLMIAFSDNTATNLVLDKVGLTSVNETMAKLGCPDTSMHAKVYRGDTSIAPERSKQFGLGSITARQAVSLLSRIHRKDLVDAKACEAMLVDLAACDDKLKVRRGLPPGAKWAHKTGSVNAVRTDAGLLETSSGTVALCILTANNKDTSWGEENAAELLCGEIGKAVYATFSRKSDGTSLLAKSAPVPLAVGANNDLVADLQRTLNAVLTPSAELSVDGDFGSVTEAAVKRLQREKGLEATGIVDAETWKALGPIVTDAKPVPDPQALAREAAELPTAPPDDPAAPPFVTAAAWAIGDANTGEILWNSNSETPRDMASTTKIMCAYVVLELAAKDLPAVLEEIVTISETADRTPGSTADVRAGETIPVRELLYGLLLPSGNDAARAFAEHFGPRLEAPAELPDDADPSDPAENFIAEMNRAAKRLGLESSGFRNPHGLTARGHRISPADLIRLARAALDHDLFREVINTRLRGFTITGPGGYQRNCRWENTNKLLGIEGYAGVKTGTTDAAGACLVSLAEAPPGLRNGSLKDRKLIMAVLGATSSDARYTDSRNLYRWAWQQLAESTTVAPQEVTSE